MRRLWFALGGLAVFVVLWEGDKAVMGAAFQPQAVTLAAGGP